MPHDSKPSGNASEDEQKRQWYFTVFIMQEISSTHIFVCRSMHISADLKKVRWRAATRDKMDIPLECYDRSKS